jgi:predicted metalloendopeptidase
MDRSVKPGDDFYRYANGDWLKRAEIPPDRRYIDPNGLDFDGSNFRSVQDSAFSCHGTKQTSTPLFGGCRCFR